MNTKKMPKNKRQSSALQKPAKRGIHVKGTWKAVELDPSLFSEEGMEGLVCFEELTNYRLVDSEKAAAKAAKALKREKKKAMKRKASEREEGEEKADGKEGEKTTEPSKKKAKKNKKKKNQTAKESAQQDISTEVTQKDLATKKEGGEDQTTKEDPSKDAAVTSEHDVQSKSAKKSNKKKKKTQKQQIEKDSVTEKQPDTSPSSELKTAVVTEKIPQNKVTKPPKKQAKNWTNTALSGSDDKHTDVSAWKDLFVPSPVLKALSSLGFGSPTPIQALALPSAIRDRMDVLGAAETGKLNISVTLHLLSRFLHVFNSLCLNLYK